MESGQVGSDRYRQSQGGEVWFGLVWSGEICREVG